MDANIKVGWLDPWLSRVPTLTALISLTTLLLAVSREAGYFSVVGRHYQPLLTTTDYIIGSISWLPAAALSWAGGFLLAHLLENWPRSSWHHYAITAVGLTTTTVLAITYGSVAGLISSFVLLVLVSISFAETRKQKALSRFVKAIVAVGFCLLPLSFAFTKGELDATKELLSFDSGYRLVLKQDRQVRWIVLLRSVEGGALIHDPRDRRVEFIRWAEIESFGSTAVTTPLLHRALCRITGLQNWCGASDAGQRE